MARQYKPISGIFILLVRHCFHCSFKCKSLFAQVGAFLGYGEKNIDRRNMVHPPLLFAMFRFLLTADYTPSHTSPPPPPPPPHSPVQLWRHCPGRIVVVLPLRMAAQTCVDPVLYSQFHRYSLDIELFMGSPFDFFQLNPRQVLSNGHYPTLQSCPLHPSQP